MGIQVQSRPRAMMDHTNNDFRGTVAVAQELYVRNAIQQEKVDAVSLQGWR
jgi:hypothetical protein